jgi:hypothetical protein
MSLFKLSGFLLLIAPLVIFVVAIANKTKKHSEAKIPQNLLGVLLFLEIASSAIFSYFYVDSLRLSRLFPASDELSDTSGKLILLFYSNISWPLCYLLGLGIAYLIFIWHSPSRGLK